MSAPFADVDALFDALWASRDADDEGGLSILEHCLQCAELLRASHPGDDALHVAGLVHDLGWLERAGDGWTLRLDAAHDVDGRALVQPLLGDRVASLVGGHVAAKRYLLTTDPRYATLLSHRSEVTLGFQGGLMDAAEVVAFERRSDRADLVALRRADDAAKVRGKHVDPLSSWLPVVTGQFRSREGSEQRVTGGAGELEVEERGDGRGPVGGGDATAGERGHE